MAKTEDGLRRIKKLAMESMKAFPFGSNQTGNPDPALNKLTVPQSDLDYRLKKGPAVNSREHHRSAFHVKDTTVDSGKKIRD